MKQIIFCVLAFTTIMCKPFEPLSIPKQEFNGKNLKLEGYYYSLNNSRNKAFFLFKDGTYYNRIWDGFGYFVTNLDSLDNLILKSTLQEKKHPIQYSWGIFTVNSSEIKIERWLTGNGGPYPTQMLIGNIKNDTTIHLHTQIGDNATGRGKKKTYKIDETYHFRQFSPKPDSTNNFIK